MVEGVQAQAKKRDTSILIGDRVESISKIVAFWLEKSIENSVKLGLKLDLRFKFE